MRGGDLSLSFALNATDHFEEDLQLGASQTGHVGAGAALLYERGQMLDVCPLQVTPIQINLHWLLLQLAPDAGANIGKHLRWVLRVPATDPLTVLGHLLDAWRTNEPRQDLALMVQHTVGRPGWL